MYNVYVFDMDGTLINSVGVHAHSYVLALGEEGKKVSGEEVKKLAGLGVKETLKKLGANDLEKTFRRKSEIFNEILDEVTEVDGATYVLEELKSRGYKVCLATSGSRSNTEAIMKKFGWQFDAVVTSEDVGRGKPYPDMLDRIRQKVPGTAVFVGDTEYDLKMAENAGIDALILGKDIKSLKEVLDY